MLHSLSGTPFVGFLRFTAAGGPTSIPIYITQGSAAAYTLQAKEYCVITNITVTTSDTTSDEVTITDGAGTPQVLLQGFVSTTQVLQVQVPCGVLASKVRATNPVATVGTLTAAKFVDISLYGYVTQT